MTELQLDPQMAAWLDLGPTRAPEASFEAILAAVDTAPQRRPHLRLRGRPIALTPRLVGLAAAVVVVAAAGGLVVRDPVLDALAPAAEPGDVLFGFPGTRSILEASGGPSPADETVVLGKLPSGAAFVIAARCTGGRALAVEVWDRSASYGPDVTAEEQLPAKRLDVPCDGAIASTVFITIDPPSDSMEVVLDVPTGVTWEAAVGQERDLPGQPLSPPLEPVEGTVLIQDFPPMVVAGHPGQGIGIQPAPSGELVTVLVQCLGDPVTITNDTGVPPVQLECADITDTTRIEMPVPWAGTAWAGTDGFAWVRMAVEAPVGPATGGRPEAPVLPEVFAQVAFAEGDRQNVVFGTLGSNEQALLRAPDSLVGHTGGDVVGIALTEGDGAVLELWSMRDAAPIRRLASVASGRIFDSWVDPTHERVLYGVLSLVGEFEYRSVAFDGSGDFLIASGGPVSYAQAAQAVDDAHFVAEWCPLVGSCERAVYDTATGETQQGPIPGPACSVQGVIDGRLVATYATACDTGEDLRVVAQPLDGGDAVTLFEGWGDVTLVPGADGPLAVQLQPEDTRSTLSVAALDGSGAREVATFEHEPGMEPVLNDLRLPEPDWVLVAGLLGDIPNGVSIGGGVPTLVNVATGERIKLVNLPGS